MNRLKFILIWAGIFSISPAVADLSLQRQTELLHMLRHDCGSCHGMTLKGGLGHALTPKALHGKPSQYLFQSVRDGHPGTPMPPWRSILSDDDMHYLVNILQKGLEQGAKQ